MRAHIVDDLKGVLPPVSFTHTHTHAHTYIINTHIPTHTHTHTHTQVKARIHEAGDGEVCVSFEVSPPDVNIAQFSVACLSPGGKVVKVCVCVYMCLCINVWKVVKVCVVYVCTPLALFHFVDTNTH